MLRKIGYALALCAAFTTAAFAFDDVAREDTVVFDLNRPIEDPGNFNWLSLGAMRENGAHQAMWEPLFVLNYEAGQVEPWLATHYTFNDDATVWSIFLQGGVEWSDGEAFDADDVVFSVELALNNPAVTAPEATALRKQIERVEKISNDEVRFTLRSSNPRFVLEHFSVRLFSSFMIMPEHIWRGKDLTTFRFENPIGTGAYTLTAIEEDQVIWDRNDNWWGAKIGWGNLPEPKRVIWRETEDEAERGRLIAANELDAAQDLSLTVFNTAVATNPKLITWRDELPFAWVDPCPRQLEFNTTIAPWHEPRMRRAISAMIDRQAIAQNAHDGTTVPSRTMFLDNGGMFPFVDAIEKAGLAISPDADLPRAQRLLDELGWAKNGDGFYEKDGVVLSAPIIVNNGSAAYTRAVDEVVLQLRAAGVDARAVPVSDVDYWSRAIPLGEFEIAHSWLSCGSIGEPWNSLQRYNNSNIVPIGEPSPGNNNVGRWESEQSAMYTGLVETIGTLPLNAPEIIELTVAAHRIMNVEMPFVPLVQASKILPFNTTYWEGWPSEYNNYNHPAFWWGHTHQILHNIYRP